MLDSLLSMPMAKILEKMNVTREVADVLLRSEGMYDRYHILALAVEKGRSGQRLVALQCRDCDFRLECCRVVPSGPSHYCSPFAGVSDAHQSRFSTYRPVLFCRATSIIHLDQSLPRITNWCCVHRQGASRSRHASG